jgi:2-dehydropantoate 2-reductase
MKIGIIGGGSIGLLYAYYLSELYDVTLYTKTLKQLHSVSTSGVHLIVNNLEDGRLIQSKLFNEWSGEEDLTIVAVKQYHIEGIIKQIIKQQQFMTQFLFLQNGMGHLKLLNSLEPQTVYLSSVEHGAIRTNEHTVEHRGNGQTKIALFNGTLSLPESFYHISNFPVTLEKDYYEMLLKKLIVNAIINPLTALLKIKNGQIINNDHFFSVAKTIFTEIASVFLLENKDKYFEYFQEVCKNTAENHSSMYKDIEAGRPTEIDAILGYILEEAESRNIQTPICQTMYHFIKGKQF